MNTTPTIGNINAEIEKKQDKENVYTKAEVNTALDQKVNKTDYEKTRITMSYNASAETININGVPATYNASQEAIVFTGV